MFKLPHNHTHITYWQSNAQNPSSKASTVGDPRKTREALDESESR